MGHLVATGYGVTVFDASQSCRDHVGAGQVTLFDGDLRYLSTLSECPAGLAAPAMIRLTATHFIPSGNSNPHGCIVTNEVDASRA